MKASINLLELKKEIEEALQKVDSSTAIKEVKIEYLGKKGKLTGALKQVSSLPVEERKIWGQECNKLKKWLTQQLEEKSQGGGRSISEGQDMSLPNKDVSCIGSEHIITSTMTRIQKIFCGMGFDQVQGPEIEDDFHNFEALNIPESHPARAMHDTFYLDNGDLLRTHTSPVQVRVMNNEEPPFFCISSGKVYRRDFDVTHLPMFHQVEGFAVDKDIGFAQLKGVLSHFLSLFFNTEVKVRFRPSYFPFTRPSAEVDMSCVVCQASGCRICSHTSWLEVAGCGVIHPNVLKNCGIDREKFSGFAFGFGVERLAMISHRITDIRYFYENDIRFLNQFKVKV